MYTLLIRSSQTSCNRGGLRWATQNSDKSNCNDFPNTVRLYVNIKLSKLTAFASKSTTYKFTANDLNKSYELTLCALTVF